MIELKKLHIDLPGFVLRDVDLYIEKGEFFTLLGPTGAGKTLILEAIGGLIPINKGSIWVGGRDVTDVPPEERGVGIMYQDYALFPHMTVMENMTYGLRYHRKHREISKNILEQLIARLNLDALLHRSIHHLSGGEKQRVALARALTVNPSVLLLDEPLSALDPHFREEIRQALKQLHRETGITFLIVTHDFAEAFYLGERSAVINQGRIEQVGKTSEVFHQPASPFVADFVGMKNVFPATFQKNKAIIEGLEIEMGRVVDEESRYIAIRPEDMFISSEAVGNDGFMSLEGEINRVIDNRIYYEVSVHVGPVAFETFMVKTVHLDMKPGERMKVFLNLALSRIHTL